MNRLLTSLSTMAILAAAASAQCYETNLGTLLGTGDDALFALQPMNIVFPMGGVAPSYTHAHVSTNGFFYLTNGAVSGASASQYSTSAATALTNFRGSTVGRAPCIAPAASDLNVIAPGGVYLNNAIPGKCVITWVDTRTYSLTTLWTTQAQLFATGEVYFYYSPSTVSQATGSFTFGLTCGVSAGDAIASVPGMDLSVGGVSATQLAYQQFPAGTFDLAGKTVSFIPSGGGYVVSTSACGASNIPYGSGCGGQFASFYEYFPTSTLAAPALTGNSMVLTPVGGAYLATWGGGPYVAPSGGATVLAVGDDGEVTQLLSTAFPTPSGPVTDLRVHGNAIITMGSTAQTFPGSNNYTPATPAFLDAAQTAFWSWHDYNSAEVGSGAVKYEEALNGNNELIAYITWDGVESYANPEVANPSTLQFQLTLTGANAGRVVYVWVNIDGNATSTFGSAHLIGYSPGGASVDPGSINLATSLPVVTSAADVPPLALGIAPNPVIGNTMIYTTSNIPGTALLSAQLVSLAQVDPGIDLTGLGAPGCFQRIDLVTAATVLIFGSPTATYSLTLPNDPTLAGLPLAGQSASLVPGINPLSVITSNGVLSVVGTF